MLSYNKIIFTLILALFALARIGTCPVYSLKEESHESDGIVELKSIRLTQKGKYTRPPKFIKPRKKSYQ